MMGTPANLHCGMLPSSIFEQFQYYYLRRAHHKKPAQKTIYLLEGNLKALLRNCMESRHRNGGKRIIGCNNPQFAEFMDGLDIPNIFCGENYKLKEPYFRKDGYQWRNAGDEMDAFLNIITSKFYQGYDVADQDLSEMHLFLGKTPDCTPYNALIQALGRVRNGCQKYFIWIDYSEYSTGKNCSNGQIVQRLENKYSQSTKVLFQAEDAFNQEPNFANFAQRLTAFQEFAIHDTFLNLEARLQKSGFDVQWIEDITSIESELTKLSFTDATQRIKEDISRETVRDRTAIVANSLTTRDKFIPSLTAASVPTKVSSLYLWVYLNAFVFGREPETRADRPSRLLFELAGDIHHSGLLETLPHVPTFAPSYYAEGRPKEFTKDGNSILTQKAISLIYDEIMSNHFLEMRSDDDRIIHAQNVIKIRHAFHKRIKSTFEKNQSFRLLLTETGRQLTPRILNEFNVLRGVKNSLIAFSAGADGDIKESFRDIAAHIEETTEIYKKYLAENGNGRGAPKKFSLHEWLHWLGLSKAHAKRDIRLMNSEFRALTLGISSSRFKYMERGYRIYDDFTSMKSMLRVFTPFQMEFWDLSQFAPTLVGGILGERFDVYSHVMKIKNCSREKAKKITNITFNAAHKKSKSYTRKLLTEVLGFTDNERLSRLIDLLLGHSSRPNMRGYFYQVMTYVEMQIINVIMEKIPRARRLHDAVYRYADRENPIDIAAVRVKLTLDDTGRIDISEYAILTAEQYEKERENNDGFTRFKLGHEWSPIGMTLDAEKVLR